MMYPYEEKRKLSKRKAAAKRRKSPAKQARFEPREIELKPKRRMFIGYIGGKFR